MFDDPAKLDPHPKLDIGVRACTPNYRWVTFLDGDFYPVTNLFDSEGEPTGDPRHASTCVIFKGPESWVAAHVAPGDIEHRADFEARLGHVLTLRTE